MSKLIELDAAIAETWKDTGYSDPLNVMTAIRDRLETLPTVDAVEVIRCRDCKHNPLDTWFDCPMAHMPYNGDRWCWKGERKDGEHGKTD